MKEKLIALLDMNCGYVAEMKADELADHLIANSVTVREKGEWIVGMIHPYNMVVGNWKCSVCKGVSLEAKNFCPNCGADMRGDT